MVAIHLLWSATRIGYRLVRLVARAFRDLALVLWREA